MEAAAAEARKTRQLGGGGYSNSENLPIAKRSRLRKVAKAGASLDQSRYGANRLLGKTYGHTCSAGDTGGDGTLKIQGLAVGRRSRFNGTITVPLARGLIGIDGFRLRTLVLSRGWLVYRVRCSAGAQHAGDRGGPQPEREYRGVLYGVDVRLLSWHSREPMSEPV